MSNDSAATDRNGPSDRKEASAIDLSIDSHMIGDRTVISVQGELDLYTAPALRDATLSAAESGSYRLIIDLTGVPFMDSSGLGIIVSALKRLREMGGDLMLVTTPGSPPTKVLSLTGLDRAIPTFVSIEEALG